MVELADSHMAMSKWRESFCVRGNDKTTKVVNFSVFPHSLIDELIAQLLDNLIAIFCSSFDIGLVIFVRPDSIAMWSELDGLVWEFNIRNIAFVDAYQIERSVFLCDCDIVLEFL